MKRTVKWRCNARDCPQDHSDPNHVCSRPPYLCNRVNPPCESHASFDDICPNTEGSRWKCTARHCSGRHTDPSHVCEKPPYECNRVYPPCGTHSSPAHVCRGDISAFHEDAESCTNPHQAPDHVVADCHHCRFDVDIELRSHTDGYRLTPLAIPDFGETVSDTENQDYIAFTIDVEENDVTDLHIEIYRHVSGTKHTVFTERLPEEFRRKGEHEWRWDGYDASGVLDTRILKDKTLQLKLQVQHCAVTKTTVINFDNDAEEEDWVDVRIDRNTKKVEVELRVDLKDAGAYGVGESPPSEAQATPKFRRRAEEHHPSTTPHVRSRSFSQLKDLALSGVKKYWSRRISTRSGDYEVVVTPKEAKPSMDDIGIFYNTNRSPIASSNPGSVRGVVSLIGNLVPERIVYNIGWLETSEWYHWSERWVWREPDMLWDAIYEQTAAHEIGHEILSAYGGAEYSYRHRGTSWIWQKTLPMWAGGEHCPTTGEVDLMKYYNSYPNIRDYLARSVAAADDVASLIWLARVEFDED